MAFGPDGYLYIGDRRRRRRGRSDRNAPEQDQEPARQDPAHQRQRHRRRPIRPLLASRRPIRSAARSSGSTRSGRTACATRGASRSTAAAGPLYIADVGQSRYEEINREPAGYNGGRNYGWSVMEGKHCSDRRAAARWPATRCRSPNTATPAATARSPAATSTAARRSPALVGQYFFADFCSGRIWSMRGRRLDACACAGTRRLNITSFGEGEDGELLRRDDRRAAATG